METIIIDDLVNFLESNGYHKKKVVKITKEQAKRFTLKELGCLIALNTIQFGRSKEDAIANAESWMEDGKDAIIKQFFTKDIELL